MFLTTTTRLATRLWGDTLEYEASATCIRDVISGLVSDLPWDTRLSLSAVSVDA